jgi:hypothetical protein
MPVRAVAGSNLAIPGALANWPPPITYTLPEGDEAAAASWIGTGSRPAVRTVEPRSTEIVAIEVPAASSPPKAYTRPPNLVTAASWTGAASVVNRTTRRANSLCGARARVC